MSKKNQTGKELDRDCLYLYENDYCLKNKMVINNCPTNCSYKVVGERTVRIDEYNLYCRYLDQSENIFFCTKLGEIETCEGCEEGIERK